jgi:hydroxylysine kinase
MQNKILQHLARSGLTSPELVLTKSHKEMFPFYASGIQRPHYIRLLKWIPGKVLAKIQNHSYVLLRDVGRALAKVDRALQSFTHRAMHRTTLIWEMRNTALLRPFIPFLEKTNPPERVLSEIDEYHKL